MYNDIPATGYFSFSGELVAGIVSFIAVKTRIAALPSQGCWSQFFLAIINWQVYSKIAFMTTSLKAGGSRIFKR